MKMNREIKFRAWEKKMKEMFLVDDISFEWRQINTASAWRHFEEVELMQYTGIEDKNGVEIYEGDILSFNIEKYHDGRYVDERCVEVVEYGEGAFELDGILLADVFYCDDEIEIIGNRYENPELLEVES